uniref:Cysteine-rich motor neuron 1 protein n=1 Tax=Sphaerodactylus townsendi TaxID=933632 RepID=A0ACB8GB68_9SAUR
MRKTGTFEHTIMFPQSKESRCEEPKNCPGGVVLDICGCCFLCARQRNESCGGFFGLHGACDRGLRCVIRPPLNGDSLTEYEAGVCEGLCWSRGG